MTKLTLQDLPQKSINTCITAIIRMPGAQSHKAAASKTRMDRFLISGGGEGNKQKKSLSVLPVILGLCSELGKKPNISASSCCY